MIADGRRNVILQQGERLPAVACDYSVKWCVGLSTSSHGFSWATGMIFTIVSGHESAETGGNLSGWKKGVTAGGGVVM